MNLFTSSSNVDIPHFIGKSLLACIFFFSIYNIYISNNSPHIIYFDSQYKNNISTAQRYLYDYPKSPIVIVGSSRAANLDILLLQKSDIFNLSFKASGPISGLSLIRKSELKPKIVLVEINSILYDVDSLLLEKVMATIPFRLKKVLPSLREEYQPVNVFFNILMNLYNRQRPVNVFDKQRFAKAVTIKKKVYSEHPDSNLLLKRLDKLSMLIEYLSNQGIKPIFFEMPMYSELQDSPRANKIRSAVLTRFPMGKYLWIEGLSVFDKGTSDGVHLTYAAGAQVTKSLIAKLNAL